MNAKQPEEGKRAQTRRRRIEELKEAGLVLFLEKGIESVTIDEIVQRASVAKGSFYRYFRDKAELVQSLFEELVSSMEVIFDRCETRLEEASSSEALQEAYVALAAELAPLLLERASRVLLYLQENRAPAVGARESIHQLTTLLNQRALRLTRAAHTHGLLRPYPHKLSAYVVLGATERLLFALLSGDDLGDLLSLPDQLTSLILNGLHTEEIASDETIEKSEG
ncbi:MAG: TetR/AcrR family transcriptional regulator [Myxococcales bacterium]|nr:TetR/AcrR family transcriptional regulator [Myxococcales bacterium]MCB9644363.1 TetR/AcrR family transcriptional regulator [Myxococcales bacterium]